MRKFGVAVGLAIVVAWGSWLLAAPAIGPVAIAPSTAVVGVPTAVTITALIQDPLLIPASVNLQQIDATGKVVAIVGTLRDDGTNGDVVVGDKTFTIRWSVQPTAIGQLRYQVSAGFKGLLRRVTSTPVAVEAIAVGPAAQWIGPEGGRFAFPGGVLFEVPAGALAAPTLIQVDPLPSAELVDAILAQPRFSSYRARLLGGFVGAPDGLQFQLPVRVTLPVSRLLPGETPMLGTINFASETFEAVASNLLYVGSVPAVQMELTHFSGRVAFGLSDAAQHDPAACLEGPEGDDCREQRELELLCTNPATNADPRCEALDPLQPACCLLRPLVQGAAGDRPAGCACCREEFMEVTAAQVDFSQGECTIVSDRVEVRFPACRVQDANGNQVEPPPESYEMTGQSKECPKDMRLTASVKPPSLALLTCQIGHVSATVTGVSADGRTVLPATGVDPVWESDDACVTVDQAGQVQGLKPTAGVTVFGWVSKDPQLVGSSQVTVADPLVTITAADGRSVAPVTLEMGNSTALKTSLGSLAYGSSRDIWSVADSRVAAIDASSGVITALEDGTTTVTVAVTYSIGSCENTVYRSAPVKVDRPAVPVPISVAPSGRTITYGDTITLVATFANGAPLPNDWTVSWTIPAGMTIVARGAASITLRGSATGTFTIGAEARGSRAIARVDVVGWSEAYFVEAKLGTCGWNASVCFIQSEAIGVPPAVSRPVALAVRVGHRLPGGAIEWVKNATIKVTSLYGIGFPATISVAETEPGVFEARAVAQVYDALPVVKVGITALNYSGGIWIGAVVPPPLFCGSFEPPMLWNTTSSFSGSPEFRPPVFTASWVNYSVNFGEAEVALSRTSYEGWLFAGSSCNPDLGCNGTQFVGSSSQDTLQFLPLDFSRLGEEVIVEVASEGTIAGDGSWYGYGGWALNYRNHRSTEYTYSGYSDQTTPRPPVELRMTESFYLGFARESVSEFHLEAYSQLHTGFEPVSTFVTASSRFLGFRQMYKAKMLPLTSVGEYMVLSCSGTQYK